MTFAQLFALIGAEGEALEVPQEPAAGENGYATLADALAMAGMTFG